MAKKGAKQKKVTILWGLPGSGKTFYCNEHVNCEGSYHRGGDRIDRLDVDAIGRHYKGKELLRHIAIDTIMKLQHREHLILDGLVTTNAFAKDIIDAIKKINADENVNFVLHFEIVWWGEDRDACIWNDRARRDVDSTATIKGMTFEKPDESALGVKNIERKRIVRKPVHKVWAVKNDLGDTDKLESSSWSLGGTWNGYDGAHGTVSPDTPPASFDEFDKLLEKICPQITFLQYKRVYKDSVTVEEYSTSDYYGGTTHHAKFVCDLKKLYEALTAIGIDLGIEA